MVVLKDTTRIARMTARSVGANSMQQQHSNKQAVMRTTEPSRLLYPTEDPSNSAHAKGCSKILDLFDQTLVRGVQSALLRPHDLRNLGDSELAPCIEGERKPGPTRSSRASFSLTHSMSALCKALHRIYSPLEQCYIQSISVNF
jgi:hypothetical protein